MLPFRPSRTVLAIQLALLSAPLIAAETSVAANTAAPIEVIVVTAAGFEQKLVEAPASVSVISKIELAT